MIDGTTGRLELHFVNQMGRTVMDKQQSAGLLRASRPVYHRGETRPEVQIVHLGPGTMSGDRYEQRFILHEGSKVDLRYQSYTKILPGTEGSTQQTWIYLAPQSVLCMKTNMLIPYTDSVFSSYTDIHLSDSARVIIPEVILGNLTSKEKQPDFLNLTSVLRVYAGEQLILRDRLDIGKQSLTGGRAWARQYPVLGSLYILGAFSSGLEGDLHEICRKAMQKDVQVGVSQVTGVGYVLRILGQRIQCVQAIFETVCSFVQKQSHQGS